MNVSVKRRPPQAAPAAPEKVSSRQPLQTVVKALDVLRLFTLKQEWLGVREIGRMLELNSASVHNLLRTLTASGLVEQNADTKKYRLGLGLVALAGIKLGQLDLVTAASPAMKGLAEKLGETITLSVLYGHDLLYLAKFEGNKPVRVASRIGGSAPLHCSANGKVLLAFSPDKEIEAVLKSPLTRYTASTVTDPKLLKAELAQIRQQGYAVDFGGYLTDVHAVAAPIRDQSAHVIASMGIIIPANRFPQKKQKQYATLASDVADQISLSLGWNPNY
ncbi:DNA-binding IclR family transcriptional regulator [Aminobacter lissarensis]|uniref:DNA-binding IclR family transcriptional regulator n=1 Tax=Aminobacter carboxidus TaxID=376165 RepID=A0A8E1WL42_9HYPH|nr:IclR family transcriptional regulator [Aminobacter lissarensis]MBB6469092.1 DNA-binding IclR family transcriptional regulator [Aminobacter lissarensis]